MALTAIYYHLKKNLYRSYENNAVGSVKLVLLKHIICHTHLRLFSFLAHFIKWKMRFWGHSCLSVRCLCGTEIFGVQLKMDVDFRKFWCVKDNSQISIQKEYGNFGIIMKRLIMKCDIVSHFAHTTTFLGIFEKIRFSAGCVIRLSVCNDRVKYTKNCLSRAFLLNTTISVCLI